jgi:very-short-patch-repair endonuclease
MGWQEVFTEYDRSVLGREQLLAAGTSGRALTAAVKGGYLLRLRRDHYALPGLPVAAQQAVRVGGRLTCTSALALAGVFAFDTSSTHLHVAATASRLRSPRDRLRPLEEKYSRDAVVHWWELLRPHDGTDVTVGAIDAVAHAIRCQPWQLAVATADSALHLGIIRSAHVTLIFDAIPDRFQHIRSHINGRSEAGQETILRLLLRSAGLHVELQVEMPGIGRVDMVVEGVLVVEADSRLAHDGWEKHVEDRWRDVQLAGLGYMSLRPAYQHTMFRPKEVLAAVLALLAARKIVPRSR